MAVGICLGIVIGIAFHMVVMYAYQRTLRHQGRTESTECILGEFFVLVPEDKHVKQMLERSSKRA